MGPPPAMGPVPYVLVTGCVGRDNGIDGRAAATEAYELVGRDTGGGEPQLAKVGGTPVFAQGLCVLTGTGAVLTTGAEYCRASRFSVVSRKNGFEEANAFAAPTELIIIL